MILGDQEKLIKELLRAIELDELETTWTTKSKPEVASRGHPLRVLYIGSVHHRRYCYHYTHIHTHTHIQTHTRIHTHTCTYILTHGTCTWPCQRNIFNAKNLSTSMVGWHEAQERSCGNDNITYLLCERGHFVPFFYNPPPPPPPAPPKTKPLVQRIKSILQRLIISRLGAATLCATFNSVLLSVMQDCAHDHTRSFWIMQLVRRVSMSI